MTDPVLAAAVRARRAGEVPASSRWLDAEPGLDTAMHRWNATMTEVRAGVPDAVEELLSPTARRARLARTVRVLGILAYALGATLVLDLPRAAVTRRTVPELAARRTRIAFQRLGPSFVKLGQFISSGRGLFPDVLVDEFASCRDRCPAVGWGAIRRAVETELGPLERTFAHFDRTPIAAASIAQVHQATLRDGRAVVVKVQRPGSRRTVEAHTRTMPTLARLVGRAFPDAPVADPMAVVRLFATTILQELDFRLEAQNMVDVALDLEAAEVDDVVVPHPVPGLVTPTVLVMERLDGLRFDDLTEMRAAGLDTTALLLSGLRALVEGATVFGRFHGDLHAGNVIAMPGGRFGLVDFGICARLDPVERAGLQRLLVGMATRDTVAQVHGLDVLGALPDGLDPRELIARITLARSLHGQQAQLSVDDLRDGAPRVMGIFTEHKLALPPGLVLFLKDVLYLNGSTRLLAPDLDLLSLFASLHTHFDGKYGPDRVDLARVDPYEPPLTDADVLALTAPAQDAEPEVDVAPPTAADFARRFGPEAVRSVLGPIVAFVGGYQIAGFATAIVGATIWAVGINVVRRRQGHSSPLAFLTLTIIGVRGAAGLATGSSLVYFLPEIGMNFIYAGLMGATLLVHRPAVGLIARRVYRFPLAVRQHPFFHRTFSRLTLMWVGYLLLSGLLQLWLVMSVEPTTFVVVKRMFTMPCLALLIVISVRYPARAFRRHPQISTLLLPKPA